jgi:serine/threonine protein kinase
MEYVPQGSLAAKLTGRPGSVRQALATLEQLASIVAYLHRQGIVHGNLKPSNVLLAPGGVPRLVDFQLTGGLFHGRDLAQPVDGVCYLAPELANDPSKEPRPYTDIYGLGLILYEMLTGKPPFGGSTAAEIVRRIVAEEPAPPSKRNPEVSSGLERMCLRCLRKDPWRRYVRAYDVEARLRYFAQQYEKMTGLNETGSPSEPRRD